MKDFNGQSTPENRLIQGGNGQNVNGSTLLSGLEGLKNILSHAENSEPTPTHKPTFDVRAALQPCAIIELPPQSEPILWVDENKERHILARAGSIAIITSKAKGAKTSFLGALMAGAVRSGQDANVDTLGINVAACPTGKRVIHIDTESSEYEYKKFLLSTLRRTAFINCVPSCLESVSLRPCPIAERLQAIETLLSEGRPIHAVFIDGLTDLLFSVNDERETVETVETFLQWAEKFKTVFVFVVHENQKSTSGGGARGWIGSQLERKVSAHFSITKNDDGTRAIEFQNCREAGEIQPRLFHWCDDFKGFISCGVGQIKKAGRPSKFTESEIEEMKSLKESGQSLREIAKKFETSHQTISKILDSF
ncbi:MAG: hypothetical protein FMNOHCHN_03023 [Ignavibacteriaceae bacterium]|nr:hypothetical protein [Ignavibacteriaceae bacterium]